MTLYLAYLVHLQKSSKNKRVQRRGNEGESVGQPHCLHIEAAKFYVPLGNLINLMTRTVLLKEPDKRGGRSIS